jgi:hypothetical protein
VILAAGRGMTGITNRPESVEDENQRRVDARKDKLPDIEQVNRPRKDHPVDKDREHDVESRDRIAETGAGRGTDHKGH